MIAKPILLNTPSVKVVIVITTFGRHQQVTSTLKTISAELFSQPKYAEVIIGLVINNDSSAQITSPHPNIQVLSNPNLGGSGGFARGLYEASKDPSITHCLFMDDDAACDVNAIIKAYELLASSNNPKLAIAGTMVYEHKPWLVHESGAVLRLKDLAVQPLKNGLDLRTKEGQEEFYKPEIIEYGGWWFYAFPVKHTAYYPFPFFVRGDDVIFGIMNTHHIKTDIDITSSQMCFKRKNSPWIIYLSYRASFIYCSYKNKALSSFWLLGFYNCICIRYAMAYRYDFALAVIEAFKDGSKGLDFWREHIDAIEPMARIKALGPRHVYDKAFEAYTSDAYEQSTPLNKKTWLHRLLYCLTLNGHLLPKFLLKNKPYAVSETVLSPVSYAFRRRKVLIINETTSKTMELKHSKKLFFSILFKMTWLSFKALFTLNKTMKAYQKGIPSMCTREFWEGVFKAYGCLGEPADEMNSNPRENDREAQE